MASRLDRLTRRPVAAAVAGAAFIATSAVLVRASDGSPATVAVWRCVYALPLLWLLSAYEERRLGPRPRRDRRLTAIAGLCLALDLVLWHYAIEAVGAGLATVLGNLQVLIVGFAAWLIFKERLDRHIVIALPVVLGGVVLISGLLGSNAYGDNPVLGVVFGALGSTAYAAFLLILRHSSSDLRRIAGPLFDATLAAAFGSVVIGALIGDLDLVPSWPSHGWLGLLAFTSQVVGWLLITISLPRLAAALTSMLLLLQPVGALGLGALIYDEAPSSLQIAGVVLILAGVVFSARGRRRGPREVATPEVAAD
ncbi:MAG: DMT family transporter [Actinomycetota bacterium]